MSTHRFAATAALPATESTDEPRFSITHGNPTPEEVAAVAAVVSSIDTTTPDESVSERSRRAQSRRLRLGIRLRPGFSAWRRSRPEE